MKASGAGEWVTVCRWSDMQFQSVPMRQWRLYPVRLRLWRRQRLWRHVWRAELWRSYNPWVTFNWAHLTHHDRHRDNTHLTISAPDSLTWTVMCQLLPNTAAQWRNLAAYFLFRYYEYCYWVFDAVILAKIVITLITDHCVQEICAIFISARCNIYISCLSYDASVRLSVCLSVCDVYALWSQGAMDLRYLCMLG